MKVGILAGGVGSRLSEETIARPKPMVEIGGRPILWHIMKIYATQGFSDFVIALGYKGEVIKQFMVDYSGLVSDMTVSLATGEVRLHDGVRDDWTVDLIDTGLKTQTGGRLKRLAPYVGDGTFMLTHGDGLADIDLRGLLEFHRSHGKLATITAVRPPARFGHIELDGDRITVFSEKPQTGEGWINGAFYVLEQGVFGYIDDDKTHFERAPLERLAADGQLMAYRHTGFWGAMDTLRDRVALEEMWNGGEPPWKLW